MSPRQSPPPQSASPRHTRRPAPEDGASAPHPSYPWQWRAGPAHQNHPAAGSAWRTSFVRHLESDSRRYGNPQRVTLSETRYKDEGRKGPCGGVQNAVSHVEQTTEDWLPRLQAETMTGNGSRTIG